MGFFAGHVVVSLAAGQRQHHQHGCSLAGLALNRQAAARLLDEAVSHGQAESAAQTEAFGGEEGLIDAGQRRGIHAAAIVGHFDHGIGGRVRFRSGCSSLQFDRARGNMQAPPSGIASRAFRAKLSRALSS
jgi:hypothetical protein